MPAPVPWSSRPERGCVRWRLHLVSPPEIVYRFLSTDAGRESFWAEVSTETDGEIAWVFPSGRSGVARRLESEEPRRFCCEYLDGSLAEFELEPDGHGGTDLTLTNRDLPPEAVDEASGHWIARLLNLKAVADQGIDLRNHDPDRTSERGFVED